MSDSTPTTTKEKRVKIKREIYATPEEAKLALPEDNDERKFPLRAFKIVSPDMSECIINARDQSHSLELMARVEGYSSTVLEKAAPSLESQLEKMDEDQLNALFKKMRKQKKEKAKAKEEPASEEQKQPSEEPETAGVS